MIVYLLQLWKNSLMLYLSIWVSLWILFWLILLMAKILHQLISSVSHDLRGFIHPSSWPLILSKMPGPLDWKQGDMLIRSHDSFIMKWNVLLCLFFGNMHLQNTYQKNMLQALFPQNGWMFQIFVASKPACGPLNRTCFHCLNGRWTKAVASWRCVEIVEIVHQQCKSCMKGWYNIR